MLSYLMQMKLVITFYPFFEQRLKVGFPQSLKSTIYLNADLLYS